MAEIMNLNVPDGRTTIYINGDKEKPVRINLYDESVFIRAKKAMEEIESITVQADEGMDVLMKIDEADRISNEVKRWINYIFDYDVSSVVFGNFSPMTIVTKSGKTYFQVFLDAIMPKISEAQKKSIDAQRKRVDKYTAKKNTRGVIRK